MMHREDLGELQLIATGLGEEHQTRGSLLAFVHRHHRVQKTPPLRHPAQLAGSGWLSTHIVRPGGEYDRIGEEKESALSTRGCYRRFNMHNRTCRIANRGASRLQGETDHPTSKPPYLAALGAVNLPHCIRDAVRNALAKLFPLERGACPVLLCLHIFGLR